MSQKVRTRFAPSPTGYLHVGGARTALFNFLYARAKGGSFIMRIEDTDQQRSTEESYQLMLDSMRWLGLDWDEGPEKGGEYGPYRQSERLDIYKEHAGQLLENKKAYRCFCSSEELERKKKQREAMGLPPVYDGKCRNLSEDEINQKLSQNQPYVIRFKMPDQEVVVHDLVQGDVRFDASLIGDFIIVKSDGFPSYNYAVVVDDYLMQINHVIRGVGHLSNTPRQIVIYDAFGWSQPVWAHVSEIVGSDHKKLSKRHGATAITSFGDLGYPAEAFRNYMALLGWSPPDGVEFMSTERVIEQFDIARCNKSPSMFDVFDMQVADGVELSGLSAAELEKYLFAKSKMNWVSNQHIRAKDEDEYLNEILPFVKEAGVVPENEINIENEKLRGVLLSLRVYLDYYRQIILYLPDFYSDFTESSIEPEAKQWLENDFAAGLLQALESQIENTADFNEESISAMIKAAGKETNVKGKNLFMTVRSATTGKTQGLELPAYLNLLGQKEILDRVKMSLIVAKK